MRGLRGWAGAATDGGGEVPCPGRATRQGEGGQEAREARRHPARGHPAAASQRRRTLKTSQEGWWMVHTTQRPVLVMRRTARMTMAAARASSPEVGSLRQGEAGSRPVSRAACG